MLGAPSVKSPTRRDRHNPVLHRDGWKCQSCGKRSNLEVHHKEFRSRSGRDSEGNLITLCTACHAGSPFTEIFCAAITYLHGKL
ncbi:MAG: hypothetical protein DMG74_17290 [Acidobacteria bacterium]|nr:MAG: hypothetical protein DMG74_17290 [Acidobacteriota bacterium]